MVHIGKEIEAELRRQERTVSWLSRKLECDRTKIYLLFNRQSVKTDFLMQVSLALNKNFFKLLEEDFKIQHKAIKG